MGRVVAIGGGELDTTEELNKYAISLSGMKAPKLLFLGTASNDAAGYINGIHSTFEKMSCEVRELSLTAMTYTEKQIDDLLDWADIIYVGGGDTKSMMEIWRQHKLDKKLLDIYENDKAVLMGLSAGAICWFNCGHSDSESCSEKADWNYTFLDGMLDIYHYALCPHYNEEGRDSFDFMLKDKNIVGLALENETAFADNNGEISFIRSRAGACAYWIEYEDGVIKKEQVTFR